LPVGPGTAALTPRFGGVAYAFPVSLCGAHTMLRQPICGFARRVDDTVARAMAFLQHKPDFTTKPAECSPSAGKT